MNQPLFRKAYETAALLRDHPPRFRHPHKSALFELAYPAGLNPSCVLDVSRWPEELPGTISLPSTLTTDVQPNFYDYRPAGDSARSVEWHVNFADPRLFYAYGS